MADEHENSIDEALELVALPSERKSAKAFLDRFDIGRVPRDSGCYIMRNDHDEVIYVGKAKDLRARVRTYINDSDSRYSVKFLMRRVASIGFLVTSTEKEALLLENSLIKKYRPRYNVRLKDDKTYLSLRLNVKEDFPRIQIIRKYKKDGAKYFGPYSSAQSVRETVRQIHRLFPLRKCTDNVMRNRVRPCLYFQMKQCLAPCVDKADRAAYQDIVKQVLMVLEGHNADLEKLLIERIHGHAEKLEFEQAAVLRDRLRALQRTLERQRTVAVPWTEDRDVFGLFNQGRFTEFQVLFYRGGKMIGGRSFSFKQREMPLDEALSSFLLQFYAEASDIPSEILVPEKLEEAHVLEEIFSEQFRAKIRILRPQRGEKKALVELASRNAKSSFEEKRLAEKAKADILEQMQASLKLSKLPTRIECFDISTTQGEKPVGSMVVFEGGTSNKSKYRRFAIRQVEGQDDFAMMREMLIRRYKRAIEENDLPELILVDGGKGQLNVATAVLRDLGIEDIEAVGIAKSRSIGEEKHSPERFFVPGRKNPIILRQNSGVVHMMARIRDEAHRFAVTYHRKRRTAGVVSTVLTDIHGIGPEKAKKLLNKFGSVAKIRETSINDIISVAGFNEELAKSVIGHLNPDNAIGVDEE